MDGTVFGIPFMIQYYWGRGEGGFGGEEEAFLFADDYLRVILMRVFFFVSQKFVLSISEERA